MKTTFDFESFFKKDNDLFFEIPASPCEGYDIYGVRIAGMCFERCEDPDADFFGVYAVHTDAESGAPIHDWIADLPSRDAAEDMVDILSVVHEHVGDVTNLDAVAKAVPAIRKHLSEKSRSNADMTDMKAGM